MTDPDDMRSGNKFVELKTRNNFVEPKTCFKKPSIINTDGVDYIFFQNIISQRQIICKTLTLCCIKKNH